MSEMWCSLRGWSYVLWELRDEDRRGRGAAGFTAKLGSGQRILPQLR